VSPTTAERAARDDRDDRWVCVNCGFIYDPQHGDPARGFPAGTAFEALPEAWVCPLCYSSKAAFDRY
jgi:rubredoxin